MSEQYQTAGHDDGAPGPGARPQRSAPSSPDPAAAPGRSPERGGGTPWGWPLRLLSFVFWYVREFVIANLKVTADTLRPRHRMKMHPAIIAVPAASRTDTEWSLISILITLTPGTMTLSISREHGILYVHGMFVDSRESLVEDIQEMEDRMIAALRLRPGSLTRPLRRAVVVPRFLGQSAGDGDA